MTDVFRRKVIKTVAEEIGLVTGGEFEQFAYRVMEVIYPANWTERGTTIEGAPRGHTVDTSASSSELIAEISSEADYFANAMTKVQESLDHAVCLHKGVKRIWLLSSRERKSSQFTASEEIANCFRRKHPSVEAIEILDSREIAIRIFDNLDSERLVRSLAAYLPSIGRLADESAFSHHVPQDAGYQLRPDLEDLIWHQLSTLQCVTISGFSGIGKTAVAAAIARAYKDDFDAVIWCDAQALDNVHSLASIDVNRSGVKHNIENLLRRQKCLLVLDDTKLSCRNLATIPAGDSRLILTTQVSDDPNAVQIAPMKRDEARTLLQSDVVAPCPDPVFERVHGSVGGYPLLLNALNRIAQDEGWDAVDACCGDAILALEDEKHKKVCIRIVEKHKDSLKHEFAFIRWCGTPVFDPQLAATCVSSRAIQNLAKRGFLSATGSPAIRVHDMVYGAVCAVIECSASEAREFHNKLDAYIRSVCESDGPALRRIVTMHACLFRQIAEHDPRSSFLYAVALHRALDTPISVFGDVVAKARDVAALTDWRGREIDVRAIIEAVEAIYTILSCTKGQEAARASLEKNIAALDALATSSSARGEFQRDVKHHHAKMLVRRDMMSDAEHQFAALIRQYPSFAASRLQLARIFAKTNRKSEALEQLQEIVQQRASDRTSVTIEIILEALREIAALASLDELIKYETGIISSIAEARETDKSLALRLISSVAQKTWFTMPSLVLAMYDSIEWRDAVPGSDQEHFEWAQAHKSAAKAINARVDPRRTEFLEAAIEAYQRIPRPNQYYSVQYAEALVLLERFQEANIALDHIKPNERNEFWYQRHAQALLGEKRLADALAAIKKGIDMLHDHKYKAAFLEDRYKIRKALCDTAASDDLVAAITCLPAGDKYRLELEEKLAQLK